MNDKDSNHQVPIGGSTLRIDSFGKVTGKTRYVEDMVMPGMLIQRAAQLTSLRQVAID
jgi:CO/xanthine dehydrogenase Mo-binding subunit